MLEALSLRSGEMLSASRVSHSSYKKLLPICPQCGEPVHLRQREVPYSTAYFAHHKEVEAKKLVAACPLRVAGSEWARASSVIPNLSHGQFVDRFQRECCREIHALFVRRSNYLINFIEASNFLPISKGETAKFVNFIDASADPSLLLSNHGSDKQISSAALGLDDACLFLRSGYGTAVTNFIFQTAYFIAVILHPDCINRTLGWRSYEVKGRHGVFPYESWRIEDWKALATETLKPSDKRKSAIPRIATTILTLVLLRWRGVKPKINLLIVADELDLDSHAGAAKAIAPRPSLAGDARRVEVKSTGGQQAPPQGSAPAARTMQQTRPPVAAIDTTPSGLHWYQQRSDSTTGSGGSPLIESMVAQLSGSRPRVVAQGKPAAQPFRPAVTTGFRPPAPSRPASHVPSLQSRQVATRTVAHGTSFVRVFEVNSRTPQSPPPVAHPLRASRIARASEPVPWSAQSIPDQLGLRAIRRLSADEVLTIERCFPKSPFRITNNRGWAHLGRCGVAIDLIDKVVFPAAFVSEDGRRLIITYLQKSWDARSSEVHWFT
jgi:hypothetical protein